MLIEFIDLEIEYYEQSGGYLRQHRIRLHDPHEPEDYVIALSAANMMELKKLLDTWHEIEIRRPKTVPDEADKAMARMLSYHGFTKEDGSFTESWIKYLKRIGFIK